MSDGPAADIEHLRSVLFGAEREELASLREAVADLAVLKERVADLEAILLARDQRAVAVGEVLVPAVASRRRAPGELGEALRPEIEFAVHSSARDDAAVLAVALYPVMGPAIRKMIASIFSSDDENAGQTFRLEQVLLIDRTTGLLLASTGSAQEHSGDADIVSGMLDAIASFVQDAFAKPDHDGLQDLRVGDTSVLVEWGPQAVLASVVHGVPTNRYRTRAAEVLENIHAEHGQLLSDFDGLIDPFKVTTARLAELHQAAQSTQAQRSPWPRALGVAACLLVAMGVVILLL